jgi:hypothetical protein
MTLVFTQRIFEKNTHMLYFIKIRPVGAELFHADGRTDMTKLIVAFRNFANAIYCSAAISKLNLLVTGTLKFWKLE